MAAQRAAPPEIRDAVAEALCSDEFAGDERPEARFESIVAAIALPSDLPSLMQERSSGDRTRRPSS